MALTPEQLQTLIIAQVGETSTDTLAVNVPILWELFDGDPLQFLRTKLGAIEVAMVEVRKQVDIQALDSARVRLEQMHAALAVMYGQIQEQIDEAKIDGVGTTSGGLTTTAPIQRPAGWPAEIDANDPRYRGSPYPPPPTRPGRAR